MAEEEVAEGQEGQAAGGGRGGLLKLIIIVVIVLVVLGGTAFALRTFAPGVVPFLGGEAEEEGSAAEEAAAAGGKELGVLHSLRPFIVNLVDPSGKRYLKVTLDLELTGPEVKGEVETRRPQVRDTILILLSSKSFEDINTPEGKLRLRNEIISRVNLYLTAGKVKNVYFTEFVVQ